MHQRRAEEIEWRYDPPFTIGSFSDQSRIQGVPEAPKQAYHPRGKDGFACIQNPFDSPPAPSAPVSQPVSRNPSLSLQIPSSPHSPRSNKSRSPGSDRERNAGAISVRSAHSSTRHTSDIEKAVHESKSVSSHPVSHHSTVIYEEDDEYEGNHPRYHAVWVLIYLSVFNPLLTSIITLYTLLATTIILLFSPLCVCTTRKPLKRHFQRFLVPPLHFQLGLVYFRFEPEEAVPPQGLVMLVLVNVLAPFLALGVSVAAWIAAAFWMFANILGNPNKDQEGQEKFEGERNEGRAAVLGLRRWWEAWLLRGLR